MKNWKSNLFVVLLVFFILICGFMIGRIDLDDDINKENEYITEDGNVVTNKEEINNKVISSDDFVSLFIGKYNYKMIAAENLDICRDWYNLELKDNGTYVYNYGSECGGGWTLQGNYSISKDKIYLFNDNCKYVVIDNECALPNCNTLEILNYTLNDGKIKITSGTIELVKE